MFIKVKFLEMSKIRLSETKSNEILREIDNQ